MAGVLAGAGLCLLLLVLLVCFGSPINPEVLAFTDWTSPEQVLADPAASGCNTGCKRAAHWWHQLVTSAEMLV